MDRKLIYPGQIPFASDLLDTNKNAMLGLAKLSSAVLGTGTLVNGLGCSPTAPASMQISISPGEIYQLAAVDSTAYSSIQADVTHQILKQGISLDAVLLNVVAPATAGQSINYLVQAAYQTVDSNLAVLPFYNSSNPLQAFAGIGNNGQQLPTARKGMCVISIKSGVAAATGLQATPAPDAGYVGLWVVAIANGQASITAPNITPYANAPFINETLMNKISVATADAIYVRKNGTAPILQNFAGLTRSLTALGGGLVREYVDIPNAATVGGIEICHVYNCAIDPITGIWAGRDIADICWLEKWHDTAGTKEIWFAASAAAGTAPIWVQASSLVAATGAQTFAGAITAAPAALPTQLSTLGQSDARYAPVSYSSKGTILAANTTLTAAQCQGQVYAVMAAAVTSVVLPAPNANGEVTLIANTAYTVSMAAGNTMVLPDGTITLNGTLLLSAGMTATFTSASGAWFVTHLTGSPIVKPATLANQAVNLGQFANLKAATGYQKLPNGLIFQWGTCPAIAAGVFSAAILFPIAFPAACVGAFPVWVGGSAGTIEISQPSLTSFTVGNPSPTTSNPALWFAIGY